MAAARNATSTHSPKNGRAHQRLSFAKITDTLTVLDYTERTAVEHARLLAHVRRRGTPRGAHDLIIAAHAAQEDRVVLSLDANARFGDLPGVRADSPLG